MTEIPNTSFGPTKQPQGPLINSHHADGIVLLVRSGITPGCLKPWQGQQIGLLMVLSWLQLKADRGRSIYDQECSGGGSQTISFLAPQPWFRSIPPVDFYVSRAPVMEHQGDPSSETGSGLTICQACQKDIDEEFQMLSLFFFYQLFKMAVR